MAAKRNSLVYELRYLINCAKYFYPLSIKINQKCNKIEFNYVINAAWLTIISIIMFSLAIHFEIDTFKTGKLKVLTLIYIKTLVLLYASLLFTAICNRKSIVKLFDTILNLHKNLKFLKFNCVSKSKTIMFFVVSLFVFSITCNICKLTIGRKRGLSISRRLSTIGELFAEIFTSLTVFQYIIILTMSKNYYIQLNTNLKNAILGNLNYKDCMVCLKEIAKFHQELCELVNLTTSIFSNVLLAILTDCTIRITVYLYYFLARQFVDTHYVFSDKISSVYFVLQSVGWIILIVTPAELCMKHVGK